MESSEKKYRKVMSKLKIGALVRDYKYGTLSIITSIQRCEWQGEKLPLDVNSSCKYCVGEISLNNNNPRCYSSSYKCFLEPMEDFICEEEFIV